MFTMKETLVVDGNIDELTALVSPCLESLRLEMSFKILNLRSWPRRRLPNFKIKVRLEAIMISKK